MGSSAPYPIDERIVRREAWKYWGMLFAWPTYLFLLPVAYAKFGALGLVAALIPGVWLLTLLAIFLHEAWHGYVPNVPNRFFYSVFCHMLCVDPKAFRLIHRFHHGHVNTYDDFEFHPFGRINSTLLRALHNVAEMTLGSVYMITLQHILLPFRPEAKAKFAPWRLLTNLAIFLSFLLAITTMTKLVFDVGETGVLLPVTAAYVLGAIVVHHGQLIQHGNVISTGNRKQKTLATHNLVCEGTPQRVMHFFTHNDLRDHLFHHTMTQFHSRLFEGAVPLPEGATLITMREYAGVLRDMALGRERVVGGGDEATDAPRKAA
jgi:fatty acid desaturase